MLNYSFQMEEVYFFPQSTETKDSTLECKENDQIFKISHVKNVNKRKNRLTPLKLERKKQDKKVLASREGSGGKFPSNDRMKPRPTYIYCSFLPLFRISVLFSHCFYRTKLTPEILITYHMHIHTSI